MASWSKCACQKSAGVYAMVPPPREQWQLYAAAGGHCQEGIAVAQRSGQHAQEWACTSPRVPRTRPDNWTSWRTASAKSAQAQVRAR
eukprot:scaffold155846_cov33-Tisochrysis_lutea.AAC.1